MSAILALPLTLSACGGDDGGGVPKDAVAKVGSETITKAKFDHFMVATAKGQTLGPGAIAPGVAEVVVPDPPNYTNCIADKKKTAAATGQQVPADAAIKQDCGRIYLALRRATMTFLISSAWTEGEAAERGITVSDTQIKKEADQQRAQEFPKDADYLKFLKRTASNPEDLLYRIKILDLRAKVNAKVAEGTNNVTAAEVADYYKKNKSAFLLGETRDYRVVLSKTRSKAEQIKAMLSGGQSWKTVAAKYSLDKGTSGDGGLLTAVPKGQMAPSLDDATFTAKKGAIGGPVRTPAGYITFEVVKITPSRQQSLKESEAAIKQQLASQQQQAKGAAFTKDYQKKWQDRTECQKEYVQVGLCKNAPPTPAPAGTSTAGGATTNK